MAKPRAKKKFYTPGGNGNQDENPLAKAIAQIPVNTCDIRENGRRCGNVAVAWAAVDGRYKGHLCKKHRNTMLKVWSAEIDAERAEQCRAMYGMDGYER